MKKKSLIGYINKDWTMMWRNICGVNPECVCIESHITRKKDEVASPVFGIDVPQVKVKITIEEVK